MYRFWGKVRKHNQRGKKLGFPTANVNLSKKIPEGIYISKTTIKNQQYFSLTFIGTAKTFNEKKFQAETYILDFNRNIYNQWVSVNLIKKIRDNRKFSSAEELIEQMKQDEQEARKYLPLDE
ncbi:riboflavin kinase [Candidatus Daviesbacteria bacterium]|nr:riboflavin kinase [Candidatus Daviesbacteria bacterium]